MYLPQPVYRIGNCLWKANRYRALVASMVDNVTPIGRCSPNPHFPPKHSCSTNLCFALRQPVSKRLRCLFLRAMWVWGWCIWAWPKTIETNHFGHNNHLLLGVFQWAIRLKRYQWGFTYKFDLGWVIRHEQVVLSNVFRIASIPLVAPARHLLENLRWHQVAIPKQRL